MVRSAILIAVVSALPQATFAQVYWSGEGHASTAAEGYQRGLSEVVRAQGEYNVNTAQANVLNQQAESAYLDNRVKSVETYWARREMYDREMAEKNYARRQKTDQKLAKVRLEALQPDEFDSQSGAISWPVVCREERYDEYRSKLDRYFAKLSTTGLLSIEEYGDAATLIKSWRAEITANKDQYPEAALHEALRFLLKLNRELDNQLG